VNAADDPVAGHRLLPHTADVILEAWAPTPLECLSQAVQALADLSAEAIREQPREQVPVTLPAEPPREQLVRLLEEVLYLIDARGLLPVDVRLSGTPGRRLEGAFATVPLGSVEAGGASPKGVSREGLRLEQRGDRWYCRVTVDV
jgi:SHS2 domain-containing protein